MAQDAHHARLLLALVRGDRGAAEPLAARGVDPEAFLAQCRECDVHPWAHELLRRSEDPVVGPEFLAPLHQARTKVRKDNLLLLAVAEQALDRLAAAGVVPVALKGLDFLHRLYPSFDLRTADDIDVLIRGTDLERALAALREGGWQLPPGAKAVHYVRSSHHLQLRAPGPIDVFLELHWNLAQAGRYEIDPQGLYERARPLDVAGRSILRLDDTDVVAHLLLHHFSHYFDRRLKWLVDLQRLDEERAIDWASVVARIRSWNGTAAAAISLRHLRKLAPQLIPDRALDDLPVDWWRRAVTLPLRSRHPLELFRGTRHRRVQLFLAAVMLERPGALPGWLWHRRSRDRQATDHPLDHDDLA